MNGLSFIIWILFIISFDSLFGFMLFLIWKYLDLKYFSTSEIELLKQENKYLKEENRKFGGNNTEFWDDDNKV